MALENFKPRIWMGRVWQAYDEAFVFAGLANREYEGEIRSYGDSVKVTEVGDVTVNDYTGSLVYETLDDSSKTLLIDKKKYAGTVIDEVDNVQTNPKLLTEFTRKMGVAAARKIDQDLAALYTDAGDNLGTSTGSPKTITSSNAISLFSDAGVVLDDNNVPEDGRVAVIPSWLAAKVGLSQIIRDQDNSRVLQNGYMGEFMGFQIYKSNNVAKSGTSWWAPMFFRENDTIALAEQFQNMEALNDKDDFGQYVRMLMIYGLKVMRPDSLVVPFVKAGAESSI